MRALDTIPGCRQVRGRIRRAYYKSANDRVGPHFSKCRRHRSRGFARGDQRDLVIGDCLQVPVCGFGPDEIRGIDGADRGIDNLACVDAQPVKSGVQ